MRKLLSTLFSTLQGGIRGGLLFLALLTTSSLWAYDYDFEHNEIRYKIISKTELFGTVEVVGSYTNYATHFTIPETFIYDGVHYEVTRIGEGAFNNHKTITDIELPNSITSIGKNAFMNSTLKEITIPNSVTEIEEYAFSECAKLTSVTIGEGVKSINKSCFGGCDALTKTNYTGDIAGWCGIKFGNKSANPIFLSHNFYINNVEIKDLVIQKSATSIGNYAFHDCESLTSITIPNSVTSIGVLAFANCPNVTSLTWDMVGVDMSDESSSSGGLPSLGDGMIVGNTYITDAFYITRDSITSLTIGENVEHIPAWIFRDMYNLKSITIPNNVKTIGYRAFEDCYMLSSITLPESVSRIGYHTFWNCFSLSSINIPKSVISIGKDAFDGCYFLPSNFINNSSCTSSDWWGATLVDTEVDGLLIRDSILIRGRKLISSAVIPDFVIGIGKEAFLNCTNLASVTIPKSVRSIGEDAFETTALYNNESNWEEGVLYIGEYLIKANKSLIGKTYSIKNGTKLIADEAFGSYEGYLIGLYDIFIPNSVKYIGNGAFHYSFFTTLTIPNSVEIIGEGAFFQCKNLTSVTIGSGVKFIGGGAFGRDAGHTIGKVNYTGDIEGWCGIKFGDENANPIYSSGNLFINNEEPVDLVIPNEIDSIYPYAFCNCKSITSITFGENVKSIGKYAFTICSSLESVSIPESMTSIGEGAFADCSSLSIVNMGKNVTSIDEYAFEDCYSLTSITIPEKLTYIGEDAFEDCKNLYSVYWNSKSIENKIDENDQYGRHPFNNCPISTFIFGENVEEIPDYLCHNMQNIKSITIPESVKKIGSYVFHNCYDINSVKWNAKNCTLGNNYFQAKPFYSIANRIESFVFGDKVEYIPAELCRYMKSLQSITIPKSVTSVGENAFDGCSSLTRTDYKGDVEGWCQIAFGNSSSNPNYYAKNLFISGKEVAEVVFPNTVDTIYPGVFYGCQNLSSVTIPASVKSIGSDAFGGCKKLFDIYSYPTTPPKAEESSFANYNVNLYVPCDNLRDYQMDMVFGSFKYIQCLEYTTPSEPTDSTIYHPTEYVTVCEGEVYIWRSNTCYQSGIYTHTETVEDGEYIYHHVYTLELTILPLETIEYAIEAEGEYVWHDIVYTESGLYTYEYECTTEKLHLVIIPSKENQSAVVIEPSTNSATITWQKEDDAVNYIIVIQQDNEMVCTLIFDAHGNLLLEQHATSTEGSKNEIQYAEKRGDSFQYTIMGLTPTTNYSYTLTTTNAAYQTLNTYSGEFITESLTGIEDIYSPSDRTDTQKFLQSGQLLILRDGKIYNVMGQEM